MKNRVSVVNLSNRNLSKEEQVLSPGLNFAITPRTLPKEKLIQEIEPALSKLSKQEGNQALVQIAEVLRRARLPKSNLNKNERIALRQLRQDNSIHILKADKGNANVDMNRTDHDKKVQEMLTSLTYKKLKILLPPWREKLPNIYSIYAKTILYQSIFIADSTHQLPLVQNFMVCQKYINQQFHSVLLLHQEAQLHTTWHNI